MRKKKLLAVLLLVIFASLSAARAESPPTAAPTIAQYQTPMDGTLRVWLQSLGARTALGLTLDGAYSVNGDRGFQFEPGTEIKLGVDRGSIVLQAGGAAVDMGGGFTLTRHLDEYGNAGGAYIHESQKDTLYCGDLSFSVLGGTNLRVILTIDIEDYLMGVVPYEMSDTFPLEALKAQAVAARSYAMQRKQRNAGQEYDVVDTTNDQVFKGLDVRYARPIAAVNETRGVVGMLGDTFAEMFYAASNGGQTALAEDVWGRGDFGYLDIRDDPYDLENPESIVKSATIPRDGAQLAGAILELLQGAAESALSKAGQLGEGDVLEIGELASVEAVSPLYGGDSRQYQAIRFTMNVGLRRLTQEGTLGEVEPLEEPLSVDLSYYNEVRGALGIGINANMSDMVSVTELADGFLIAARRYGHGVGLSQRGAQQMAGQYGMDYLYIIGFYYPGLSLTKVNWTEKQLIQAAALPESLGYAAARPTPAPTPGPLPALLPGEYYAVVTIEGVDSTLNVRSGPAREEDLIGVVRTGARLIVMEETETGWAKMKTAEIEGYVSMEFITREDQLSEEPLQTPGMPNGEANEAEADSETIYVF